MDRIVLLIGDSSRLQRNLTDMTSQILRFLPPPSGGHVNVKPALNDVSMKSRDRRTRRKRHEHLNTEDKLSKAEDEDKENVIRDRPDVKETHSDDHREQTSRNLGTAFESYLSPLRVNAPVRPTAGWFCIANINDCDIRRVHQNHMCSPLIGGTINGDKDVTMTAGSSSPTSSPTALTGSGSKTSVWQCDSPIEQVSYSANDCRRNSCRTTSVTPRSVASRDSDRRKDCQTSLVDDDDQPPPTLCNISLISRVSVNSLPHEQISSAADYFDPVASDHVTTMASVVGLVPSAAGAFHSTFNYPLHSTLRYTVQPRPVGVDSDTSSLSDDNSNSVSEGSATLTGVDSRSSSKRRPMLAGRSSTGNRRDVTDEETRVLRRQKGKTRLEHESDASDNCFSMHATCGSIPDLNDLSQLRHASPVRRHLVNDNNAIRADVIPCCRHCFVDQLQARRRRYAEHVKRCHRNSEVVKQPHHVRQSNATGCHSNTCRVISSATLTDRARCNANVDEKLERIAPSSLGYGCLPTCHYGNDSAVAFVSTRRRRIPASVYRRSDVNGDRKRSLASKLRRFSNILCSTAGVADSTHVVKTLGHL